MTERARSYWCAHAWLPDGPAGRVRVHVDGDRITSVVAGVEPDPADHRLPGLVLPGFANAHSHAFHRALRGRTHGAGGTFWTWRERMYRLTDRLDPDSYLELARAAYAEMALAGVSAVGEFHYLHHPPAGGRYREPNAMGGALVAAAADAGIRLTVLDTCYLAGGLTASGHTPPDAHQERFSDGDAEAWADRVAVLRGSLASTDGVRVGAAVHSVRAVPAGAVRTVVAGAAGGPLHVHLSEQPAENEVCRAYYRCTPTELLAEHGVLGPGTTAVHAIHLTDDDVTALGTSGTTVCACPSTEADLADGIGPFTALRDAGCPLAVGSDQHALADPLAEARLVEAGQRLASGRRGRIGPAALVEALTTAGQACLGWNDAGALAPGRRADLVAVRLDSPRTAGTSGAPAGAAAGAVAVHTVVVDGQVVVADGIHQKLGDVGPLLARAIAPLWEEDR